MGIFKRTCRLGSNRESRQDRCPDRQEKRRSSKTNGYLDQPK
jgi:hypothetical protein